MAATVAGRVCEARFVCDGHAEEYDGQLCEVRHPDGEVTYWCCACWNHNVEQEERKRKAHRDAQPRCEVPSCNRRGTWTVGAADPVLLCGHHKNRAVANGPRQSMLFAASVDASRETILAAAVKR